MFPVVELGAQPAVGVVCWCF